MAAPAGAAEQVFVSAELSYTSTCDENLICSICLSPVLDPRCCKQCEHFFCGVHLPLKTCPSCRLDWAAPADCLTTPPRPVLALLDGLVVICPNVCKQSFKRGLLPSHLKVCPVQCPTCAQQVLFAELQVHHADLCPEALAECPAKCGIKVVRREIPAHLALCPEEEVACPLACDAKLARRLLTGHAEQDCPRAVVACPWACTAGGENSSSTVTSFERRALPAHELRCPMKEVACEAADVGCTVLCARGALPAHQAACHYISSRPMLNTFNALHADNVALKAQLAALQQSFAAAQLQAAESQQRLQVESAAARDQLAATQRQVAQLTQQVQASVERAAVNSAALLKALTGQVQTVRGQVTASCTALAGQLRDAADTRRQMAEQLTDVLWHVQPDNNNNDDDDDDEDPHCSNCNNMAARACQQHRCGACCTGRNCNAHNKS